MHITRILYIRPFSKRAYGAEEKDLESGLLLLKNETFFKVYDIRIDLKNKSIISDLTSQEIDYKLNLIEKLKFFINKCTVFDNAMKQSYTYNNYITILKLTKILDIDVIVTNTTCTVLFGDYRKIKHIFRSVSFEPIYVFKTVDKRLKAILHSFLKLISIRKEFKANVILSISPRDARYYRFVGRLFPSTKIEILPLRQLFTTTRKVISNKSSSDFSFAFLGSTYNVLHNKKSFDFVLNNIPPNFWIENHINLNIYGRKIPEVGVLPPNIVIHNWVEDIEEIYNQNIGFLVPFFLASGMQSKVFEPLIRGKVLICDPRVLSGYKFQPFKHYLPAKTGDDFMNAILMVKNSSKLSSSLSLNAAKQSEEIIGSKIFVKNLIDSILIPDKKLYRDNK
jgi:hypothetical protein